MKTMLMAAIVAATLASPALADSARLQSSVPGNATTVTNWYKQGVYDAKNNKIGDVNDVLTSKDGKIETLIIGVGGFLGVGEKDVAVPFTAVKVVRKDDKPTLVMDTTKDELKQARGFKYDKTATTWKPDAKSDTK
jgi:sporulation protein YlmC with PRC-barrel domain